MSFTLSKILWMFLSPGSLLVLLLGAGIMLRKARHQLLRDTGRFLCSFVVFCLIMIATFPVGEWALAPLENRFGFDLPNRVDGILMLGGDESPKISGARGQAMALDSTRRYIVFSKLLKRYPKAKLVYSGGSPSLNPGAEIPFSDVVRGIMANVGIPTDRVIFENNSRNTFENAYFSTHLIRPEASQNWLLVTSAWHMPRAIGCFRAAGWNVHAAPTGYFTTGKYSIIPVFHFDEQMTLLTLAAHEYVGLVSYWLMRRTSAPWPG